MSLSRLARRLYRAIVAPAPSPVPVHLGRAVLRQRRIFDLVSFFLQRRDFRSLATIGRTSADEDAYISRVHDYNAEVTLRKVITTTRRAEPLYQVIALPARDLSRERLLIVGPRNVHELLIAWLHGFAWTHIEGIDLYSTNPKIHVMNMEQMTFEPERFHAVVMSNTLAYASDTFRCLSEITRVLKPDGRVVFGATYDPGDTKWAGSGVSGEQILAMLRKLSLDLYYYHPTDKINSLGRLQTSHLFGCVKRDPAQPGFDRIPW